MLGDELTSTVWLTLLRMLLNKLGQRQSTQPERSYRTAPAPGAFQALIEAAARRYDLDPALLNAVIQQESGFKPNVVSPAGAVGLMQLMPGTARSMGVTNPFDPAQNIDGGARYLRTQLDRFGSLPLALAAYNAGPGAVHKFGGIPPYAETQRYVRAVSALYERYKEWIA